MKPDPEKKKFQKVTFTIPVHLLEKIDRAAEADNRSRSQWMALQFANALPEELKLVKPPEGKAKRQNG